MNSLQQHDRDYLTSCQWLLGVDEAGRGCLAGAVVAGACLLSANFFDSTEAIELSSHINDSKQLSAEARADQFVILKQLEEAGLIHFAVALASVDEIAALNILGATRLAMQRAIEDLASRTSELSLPEQHEAEPLFQLSKGFKSIKIIVDGRPLKPFPYAHEGIVKGDGKSLSIAMASIAAKVSRDQMMKDLAVRYPVYDFAGNKGYGTQRHRDALLLHGACPEHRALFLRKVLPTHAL